MPILSDQDWPNGRRPPSCWDKIGARWGDSNRSVCALAQARGFTLIEVLVAFVILAVALGVLLQVFSTGLRNARVAEAYTTATLYAESMLAAVGIEEPLAAGETSGEFDDRFRWRLDVQPYEIFDGDDEASAERAFQVVVTVSWGDEDDPRDVTLTTLRLAPAE
jgi:general secretion pathway protein I